MSELAKGEEESATARKRPTGYVAPAGPRRPADTEAILRLAEGSVVHHDDATLAELRRLTAMHVRGIYEERARRGAATEPANVVVPFVGAASIAASLTGLLGGLSDGSRAVLSIAVGVLAVVGVGWLKRPVQAR